jgi:hypothetical protein
MQLGKSLMIAGPTYNPFDSKAIKRAIYGFGIPKTMDSKLLIYVTHNQKANIYLKIYNFYIL